MKKIKIAFVIHGLHQGGSEMFYVNLVNGLAESQFQIFAIILDDKNPLVQNLDTRIKILEYPRKNKYDFSVISKIRSLIKNENINEIFCVEPFSFLISKLAVTFLNNPKLYLSLHNSLPITRKKHLLDIIIFKFFNKKDKAIFICEKQINIFKDLYKFNPQQRNVIYNGVNTDYYSRHNGDVINSEIYSNWKNNLNLTENDKTIILVGRLSIEKGHIYAIEALSVLHKKFKFIAHLIFVGGGSQEMEKRLKDAALRSGVNEFIHFIGPQKDVRPFLAKADIFTLTSFSETFSIAALEAMSMGLPCSLTNVGGASEMLIDKSMGNLSEAKNSNSIAESWYQLLNKEVNKDNISTNIAKYFSMSEMIKNYSALFNTSNKINLSKE